MKQPKCLHIPPGELKMCRIEWVDIEGVDNWNGDKDDPDLPVILDYGCLLFRGSTIYLGTSWDARGREWSNYNRYSRGVVRSLTTLSEDEYYAGAFDLPIKDNLPPA